MTTHVMCKQKSDHYSTHSKLFICAVSTRRALQGTTNLRWSCLFFAYIFVIIYLWLNRLTAEASKYHTADWHSPCCSMHKQTTCHLSLPSSPSRSLSLSAALSVYICGVSFTLAKLINLFLLLVQHFCYAYLLCASPPPCLSLVLRLKACYAPCPIAHTICHTPFRCTPSANHSRCGTQVQTSLFTVWRVATTTTRIMCHMESERYWAGQDLQGQEPFNSCTTLRATASGTTVMQPHEFYAIHLMRSPRCHLNVCTKMNCTLHFATGLRGV